MSKKFFILSLRDVPVESTDRISGELFEFGATGIQEDIPFVQSGEFYEVTEVERDETSLLAYFDAQPAEDLIYWLKEKFPDIDFHIQEQESKDWLAEWKKGYVSFELVGGIFVVPSWCEVPVQAKQSIKIDPGMAFGTGTHETTQLAAKLISLVPKLSGQSVLDVGTGTGILGFLTELLGAKRILGLEIDIEARRTARENAALNDSQMEISDSQIELIDEQFDFVIANIIDGVLVKLQSDLKRCLKPGGHLLLTGILDERDANFRERFSFDGFELIQRSQNNEWIGYLLKHVGT